MPEDQKFYCLCGCKAYIIPHFFPQEFVLKYMEESDKAKYNPDDEFYHIKTECDVWICSGTERNLKNLVFPKNHWTFSVDQPCDFNSFRIYNRYDNLILTPIVLQGDCKCLGNRLPVKQ